MLMNPLMKLFSFYKIISRQRLINVDLGVNLERYLTVSTSIFKIGGDDIKKADLRSAPTTRGKLEVYSVSLVASQSIG